jgi:hypothetical protein
MMEQYCPLILVETREEIMTLESSSSLAPPSIVSSTSRHSSYRPKSVRVPSRSPVGGNLPEESRTVGKEITKNEMQ